MRCNEEEDEEDEDMEAEVEEEGEDARTREGFGGGRRDCRVAGVVSESRVQPSGSYEYII